MTGIIIPLYLYPADPEWKEVARAQRAYPYNPIIAVINPNSGPGTSIDTNYSKGISMLKRAGVKVLGYVATTFGAKPFGSIANEMTLYRNWYLLDSWFFDEVQADAAHKDYYAELGDIKDFTVGNPGTWIPENYIGIFHTTIIHEGPTLPPPMIIYPDYDPENFGFIVHSQATFPKQAIFDFPKDAYNYIYITKEPSYGTMPYLWDMLKALFERSRK